MKNVPHRCGNKEKIRISCCYSFIIIHILAVPLRSCLFSLVLLPAALIRGNRKNCAQFSGSLDWLISRLERLEASSGRSACL